MMTRPSDPDAAGSADPEVAARASGAGWHSPFPRAVEMSTDLLDAIVDEIFAVGLALRAGARGDGDGHRTGTEQPLDGLDRVIALIRQAALAGTSPPRPPLDRQPELVALSSLPNGELSTIELIDAAHCARRAVIALQNITGPEERRPAEATVAPSTHTGRTTLAEVAASGEP